MTFTNRFSATAMNRTNLSCSASMGMNCAYTAAMQTAMNIVCILGAIFVASIICALLTLLVLVVLQLPVYFYTPLFRMTA